MSEPVTQALFLEVVSQLEARIDGGHGRVRQSLNELKSEVKVMTDRLAARQETCDRRMTKHSETLVAIQTARAVEAEAARSRKQDARDRTVLITTLTSLVVTIGLFVIKALLRL